MLSYNLWWCLMFRSRHFLPGNELTVAETSCGFYKRTESRINLKSSVLKIQSICQIFLSFIISKSIGGII